MKSIWLFSIIAVVAATTVVSIVLVKRANVSKSAAENSPTISSSEGSGTTSSQKVAGEYWCRSYNYNGAGGSCSLQRKLILNTDGSYTFGSSSGHYTFSNDKITFDGDMAKRGPAVYTTDQQIRWEFTENNAPYTITYYFRQAV